MRRLVTTVLFFTSLSHAVTLLRVACGSNSVVTDATGQIWNSDSGFSGGTSYVVTAALPEPFRHLRFAQSFSYSFQLQAATAYSVTLRFIEPNKTGTGQRIFNVSANGNPQIISMDLFALANGANHSYDRSFPITVGADGKLTLQFNTAIAGQNALISAIQIDDVPQIPTSANDLKCMAGRVISTQLPAGAFNAEITIVPVVSGDFRYEHVMVSEFAKFDGTPAPTVSMGRPGTNNSELTGAVIPLGVSNGDVSFWYAQPTPPQIFGVYPLVLNFMTGAAGGFSQASGILKWEVCGYSAAPTAATLTGLSICNGSGTGTYFDANGNQKTYSFSCDGIAKATIALTNGATMNLVGADMPDLPTNSAINWVAIPVK